MRRILYRLFGRFCYGTLGGFRLPAAGTCTAYDGRNGEVLIGRLLKVELCPVAGVADGTIHEIFERPDVLSIVRLRVLYFFWKLEMAWMKAVNIKVFDEAR